MQIHSFIHTHDKQRHNQVKLLLAWWIIDAFEMIETEEYRKIEIFNSY